MTLSNNPKAQLAQAGLNAKHHFGQNFLADAALCRRVAECCAPAGTRHVVEIGAGLGALTAPLLERAERVTAIERDRDLLPSLHTTFLPDIEQGRLFVIEADAKGFDYRTVLSGEPRPATLAGNLPYQITGPLLRRALEVADLVARCAFLVQLEVAERLTARPASSQYGALTVFLQARFAIERQFVIRRGAFYPQPNVDSAVVTLTPLATPLAEETPLFRALVKAAFGQRRKKLRNAWSSVCAIATHDLADAAALAEIDLDLRGEVLSVRDYAKMAQQLSRFAPSGTRKDEDP